MEQKPLAVISGGGGFVGSAMRRNLEKNGWLVISLGRRAGEDDETLVCDITNEEQVEDAIERVVERYGDISACIHAATAPTDNKSLLEMDVESFEVPIRVSVRGAFLIAKAVVPHMKAGAAFIGITSKLIEPEATLPPTGSYAAAKYGLRGFLRALSSDALAQHIRVYAVAPGFLPGGLNRAASEAMIQFLATRSGIGTSTVEEVADLVQTLCDEKDAYIPRSSISLSPTKATKL